MKKLFFVSLFLVAAPFFAFAQPTEVPESVPITCGAGMTYSSTFQTCVPNSVNQTVGDTGGTIPTSQLNQGGAPQEFVPIAPIPGLTQGATATNQGFAAFFNNLYIFLIGLAAVLAVVMIILGGIQYATTDNVSKKSDGKARIQQALLGLILVLLPVLVFSIINPKILNLSPNWSPVRPSQEHPPFGNNLPGGNTNTGGSQTPQQTTGTTAAIAAGCTVTGTLLKTATCPTSQAAQNFASSCTSGSGSVAMLTLQHVAYCPTTSGPATGPFGFVDTATTAGLQGWVNFLTGYSYYQPLARTSSNPGNGQQVISFGSSCTADGGTTCLSAVQLPCLENVVNLLTTNGGEAFCWSIGLSCVTAAAAFQSCPGGSSSNPQFQIVN